MTKNTSRSTMGGIEKSRFLDYFFCTIGDFIPKNSVFLRIFQMSKKIGPSSNRNLGRHFEWKKCQDSQHVMSKIHEFWEYQFKFFSCFSKKVEKKWIFLTPFTYWKSEEKHKKKDFFLKNYKNHFPINNGWKLKKTQNKFISFTIVNTKTIVHTTVNTCCFSMILPYMMVYLRIVPFSVCFTI